MWTRSELKNRAKSILSCNYWVLVLGALILSIITGGFNSASSINTTVKDVSNGVSNYDINDFISSFSNLFSNGWNGDRFENLYSSIQGASRGVSVAAIVGSVVVLTMIVFMIAGLAISIFLFNPLIAGGYRFFNRSLVMNTKINEFAFAFKRSYLNVVKIMFLRQLYIFLWSLLFIIPGIIKAYEYYLVPYIVGDDPDISASEAFRMSKELMRGNKFKVFVLELSFLGWYILSGMTCGLLSVFYVAPYVYLTKAALYRRLRGLDDIYSNQGYNNGWNNGNNGGYNNGWDNGNNGGYNNGWNNGNNGGYNNGWNNGNNGGYNNGWENQNNGNYNNWDNNRDNGRYQGGTWDSENNRYRDDDR